MENSRLRSKAVLHGSFMEFLFAWLLACGSRASVSHGIKDS